MRRCRLAAELLGYSSGDELVQALVKTRPMDELIDEKTDSLMRKEYGDMLTDRTAAEKAREAVMTIRRSEVIEAEQQALAKAVRAAEPLQAALVAAIAKWFRGDDEDSWAETLAREGLSSAFGLMVGVREAEGAAERLLLAGAISARLFGAGRAARLLRLGRPRHATPPGRMGSRSTQSHRVHRGRGETSARGSDQPDPRRHCRADGRPDFEPHGRAVWGAEEIDVGLQSRL